MLTIDDVYRLPVIQEGRPQVLGNRDLSLELRWVHVTESPDNIDLLFGRELVLTTLRNVEHSVEAIRSFIVQLQRAGAVGVVVEYVENSELLETAAEGLDIPVIRLRKKVRFVAVTELIHQRLVAEQLHALEFSRSVHEIYTDLSLHEADEQHIVERTAQLLQGPVVLEDVSHHVLAHAGSNAQVLSNWINRSRHEGFLDQTGRSRGREHWLQTPVGGVHRRWGRLILPGEVADDQAASLVLERAGQALTIARLASRDQQELLYQARTSMLRELQSPHGLSTEEVLIRAQALGLQEANYYIPIAVSLMQAAQTPTQVQLWEREVLQVVDHLAESMRLGVLAGSLKSGFLGVIIPVSARELVENTLQGFVRRLHEHVMEPLAVGVAAEGAVEQVIPRLEEAVNVAQIVPHLPTRVRPYYRFGDLRLRGALSAMSTDARMRNFALTELQGLLHPLDEEGINLLEQFLNNGGNKSALARESYYSRPTLYAKLQKLEEKLGVSLSTAESRASLHVALLWYRMQGEGN